MLQLLKREERESARDFAYRVIRHNIIELKLPPGSTISEKSLCEQLQLSRTPVRESLIDLSRQHLVDIRPQRGTNVSLIHPELVHEGHFLRALVEEAVVRDVCNMIDDNSLRQLESNLLMQKYFAENNDIDEFISLDTKFHKKLFEIASKSATYQIVADFQAHLDRGRKLSLQFVNIGNLVQDHMNILRGIREHNPDVATEYMRHHLSHVLKDQYELMKQFPQYFS